MRDMTDNEIIKALECCFINGCKNCKYKGKAPDCMTALQKDTIDLINRQKAEILELQKRIINWRADMDYRPDEIKSEAIKEFAEGLCDGRVSNDPVVIAVKTELQMTEGQKK